MTEQMLLRFAMILQDQAPSTLNKYICKLAEAVLADHPIGLSLLDLSQKINSEFNLTFTLEEIESAISKKGHQRIVLTNGAYTLHPSVDIISNSKPPLSERLYSAIEKFSSASSFDMATEQISNLLLKYLYFCFNSNVGNLLSLFNKEEHAASKSFEASAEEISIINAFIAWEEPEKDSLIYSLITTCYEYCMLTIKKDNILSAELFRGKRFYLDANIIFRMAGFNNVERKTVTTNFVQHCKKVGIELYCTSTTLDEVYRVITSQIEYIRSIAGNAMPVSSDVLATINPFVEINDFYKIYYEWCQASGNTPGDYTAFNAYLLSAVQGTLRQLKIKESRAYVVGLSTKQFSEQVNGLIEYKNARRKWRNTSTASAETDITNIMDTLELRKGTGSTIWQTNDFIVSADQLLIGWTGHAFPGVPLVVLPSVWLSIILRFTGRTDDDYKSFCLFLTQRQHIIDDNAIDPIQLLRSISLKTTQTELKEQIIVEITQNKSQYIFNSKDDYDTNTDRAFDVVLSEVYGKNEQQIKELREEMQQQVSVIIASTENQLEDHAKLSAAAEREKTIVTLSKKQAAKRVALFRTIRDHWWWAYLVCGLIVAFGFVVYLFEIPPLYSWTLRVLPVKMRSANAISFAWIFIAASAALLSFAIQGMLASLSSEEREEKLFNRFYKKNRSLLS